MIDIDEKALKLAKIMVEDQHLRRNYAFVGDLAKTAISVDLAAMQAQSQAVDEFYKQWNPDAVLARVAAMDCDHKVDAKNPRTKYDELEACYAMLFNQMQKMLRSPADGWQPIESAPRDGTSILLMGKDDHGCFWEEPEIAMWCDKAVDSTTGTQLGGFVEIGGGSLRYWNPTHWMPLPLPPTERREM